MFYFNEISELCNLKMLTGRLSTPNNCYGDSPHIHYQQQCAADAAKRNYVLPHSYSSAHVMSLCCLHVAIALSQAVYQSALLCHSHNIFPHMILLDHRALCQRLLLFMSSNETPILAMVMVSFKRCKFMFVFCSIYGGFSTGLVL